MHRDTHKWQRPTRCTLYLIIYFTQIIRHMFRISNCPSSGGVLYKQLTVFNVHLERVLVADTMKWYHFYDLKYLRDSGPQFGQPCLRLYVPITMHFIKTININNQVISCSVRTQATLPHSTLGYGLQYKGRRVRFAAGIAISLPSSRTNQPPIKKSFVNLSPSAN